MNFTPNVPKPKRFYFNKKTKLFFSIVVVGIVLIGVAAVASGAFNPKGSQGKDPGIQIDQTFESIGRVKDGRPTDGTLPIKITSAEITDSVLVKGQRAYTRNNKLFLVVYLEIENKYPVTLYSKPVDLLRLVRADGKRAAPSVSQGDVEIRAISVKRTNVAFVIDRGEKNFTIEVGEVDGEKQAIQVNFK